jgi:hypothetical protein
MGNGLDYQQIVRRAIRDAPPPPLMTERPPRRLTDSDKRMINACWSNNMKNQRRGNVPYASKEELYLLAEKSGGICNLSGVHGNWEVNSPFKFAFDRIVPGFKGGKNLKESLEKASKFSLSPPCVGTYQIHNLQIILSCVNTAKCAFNNEDIVQWLTGYKTS